MIFLVCNLFVTLHRKTVMLCFIQHHRISDFQLKHHHVTLVRRRLKKNTTTLLLTLQVSGCHERILLATKLCQINDAVQCWHLLRRCINTEGGLPCFTHLALQAFSYYVMQEFWLICTFYLFTGDCLLLDVCHTHIAVKSQFQASVPVGNVEFCCVFSRSWKFL